MSMLMSTLTPVSLPEAEHLVSDEYLTENHLALIRVSPSESYWPYRIPGKQYLCPALGPDGPWIIQENTTDGKVYEEMPGDYELVSDPLDLLTETASRIENRKKQQRNLEAFKHLHSEIPHCRQRTKVLYPSGRTGYEEQVVNVFQSKVSSREDSQELLKILDECLAECREYQNC